MPLGLAIYCNGLSGITPILNAAANKGILGKVLATLDEDEYKYMLAKLLPAKVMRPSMITGGICCVIAALIVGGGCFAANFGLSTLVVVGIAVAVALVVGVVSGGITYAVLKFNHNKHFDNERSVNRNQSQESAKEMENFIEEPRHMDKATNTENVEELKPKEKPVPVVDNLIDLDFDYDKMDKMQPSAAPLSEIKLKKGELYPWSDLSDLSKSDQQI